MNQLARASKTPGLEHREEGEGRGRLVAVDAGREIDAGAGPRRPFGQGELRAAGGSPKLSTSQPAARPAAAKRAVVSFGSRVAGRESLTGGAESTGVS